jgi:hypothetical protein
MTAQRRMRIFSRPIRIGVATLTSMLAWASTAHAHGGMAGPSELGPPLLTSGALGFACYWLVMLWPSPKNRRTTPDGSNSKSNSSERLNEKSNGRKSARAKKMPHLKKIEGKMRVDAESSSRRNVIDA